MFYKTIKLAAFMLISLGCFIACQKEGKKAVTVTVDEADFPILSIENPSGNPIVIQAASSTEGSIGFSANGKTTWLKGNPDEQTDAAGKTTLTWDLGDVGKAMVTATPSDGDLDLTFHLEGNTTPDQWLFNVTAANEEYFTGIFERVVDGKQDKSWKDGIQTGMNLRGERVEMHLKPTVSAYAPFYISSSNYGLFVHGTWPGVFDFVKASTDKVKISFEGPDLSMRWYLGKSPMQIVQQHALETGPSFVPPQWVFGPWRWRDEHFNNDKYYDSTEVKAPFNSDIVEDVLMMKAYDIPCTAHWIDRPWGPGVRGFDDYNFDTIRLPQPEKMIAWLNEKDIELMMWIGPFVMGEMANYAEEEGYDLRSHRWKDSRQVLMDFTNAEAAKWWGENGPGKLAKMGIKGYKLDRADGEKLMDSLHLKTHAGTTYRENFNDYPHQYVKATYEAVQDVLGDDFVLFPRAQYTGSAKYGSMWAGDTNGKPEGLRSAIIGLQRCSVMGYPVWGSDVGGYWGDFSQETCKRWLAFGCFSPIMEVGPTNNRGFWNNPDEPHYDPELIAIWRLYSKLRMKLVPYVQKLAQEAHETGTPVARPLFLAYPDQEEAWNDWQTYLFGPDILVSAVWQSGVDKHRMYIPEGEEWVDAWDTNHVVQGGQYIEVDVPLHKMPIFIRKGADIDLGDLNALFEESMNMANTKPDLAELEKQEGWR